MSGYFHVCVFGVFLLRFAAVFGLSSKAVFVGFSLGVDSCFVVFVQVIFLIYLHLLGFDIFCTVVFLAFCFLFTSSVVKLSTLSWLVFPLKMTKKPNSLNFFY